MVLPERHLCAALQLEERPPPPWPEPLPAAPAACRTGLPICLLCWHPRLGRPRIPIEQHVRRPLSTPPPLPHGSDLADAALHGWPLLSRGNKCAAPLPRRVVLQQDRPRRRERVHRRHAGPLRQHRLHAADAVRQGVVHERAQAGRVHALRRRHVPGRERRDGVQAVRGGQLLRCWRGGAAAVRGWQLLERDQQRRAERLHALPRGLQLHRWLDGAIGLPGRQRRAKRPQPRVRAMRGGKLPERDRLHDVRCLRSRPVMPRRRFPRAARGL
mmetsp:Transcript_8024/g.23591  ORF Transcript_8024/g.23591 Transcript_8024/m.23591 type:complete len:271 (-) Transcript_8024:613-1425(-)